SPRPGPAGRPRHARGTGLRRRDSDPEPAGHGDGGYLYPRLRRGHRGSGRRTGVRRLHRRDFHPDGGPGHFELDVHAAAVRWGPTERKKAAWTRRTPKTPWSAAGPRRFLWTGA